MLSVLLNKTFPVCPAGKEILLAEAAEEVAGFYAKMLDHDYTTKDVFNNNFFKDWRKVSRHRSSNHITLTCKLQLKHNLPLGPKTSKTASITGVGRSSEVERSLMVRWVVGSFLHGVDPLSYF